MTTFADDQFAPLDAPPAPKSAAHASAPLDGVEFPAPPVELHRMKVRSMNPFAATGLLVLGIIVGLVAAFPLATWGSSLLYLDRGRPPGARGGSPTAAVNAAAPAVASLSATPALATGNYAFGTPRTVWSKWNVTVRIPKEYKKTYTIWSDGTCDTTEGTGTWSISESFLIMKWPNPKAPGKVWIDTLVLNKNKSAFKGSNQAGMIIEGELQ
ncbi:hypothetical protein BH09SUM1_BH09SUM1_19050 [soil metagenome]